MAIKTRSKLKSWFYRAAKPLSSQFADWIDSFYHKDEDKAYVGLRPYSELVAYEAGMTCVRSFSVWLASKTTTGAWDPAAWDVIGSAGPSGTGNAIVVHDGEELTIPVDCQYSIYSKISVESGGRLIIDGELVIFNGELDVQTGGYVEVNGNVRYVQFYEILTDKKFNIGRKFTGSETLVVTDANTLMGCSSAADMVITIPSGKFAAGDVFSILQDGAGVVTAAVANPAKQSISAACKTSGQDSIIHVLCYDDTPDNEVYKVMNGVS